MPSTRFAVGLGAVLAVALAGSALAAQQPAAPAAGAAPRPAAVVTKNPAQTVAGTYRLDPNHASVIARLSHAGGYSMSTFRFGKVAGTLNWDPANVANSKIEVTVDPKSLMTPVPNFAEELIGERFLNTTQYPEMKFVSTAVHVTGATTGHVMGNLTFMGQTKPITVEAELVGGGRNGRGVPVIGFAGKTKIKRSDFGWTTGAPALGDEVELIIDLEFNQPQQPAG